MVTTLSGLPSLETPNHGLDPMLNFNGVILKEHSSLA